MEEVNRNNYEEYFLLYIDKELSAEKNLMVEDFIQKNPDLAGEFNTLMAAKLQPDYTISWNDKKDLIKHESFINTKNYTEISLLYIDHELSPDENHLVEKFYHDHPELKAGLTALQSTILPKEHIIFADKKSLYKHDGEIRFMDWKKYAVAAAVLLFVLAAWLYFPAITNQPIVAINDPAQTPAVKQQNQQSGHENDNDTQKNNVLPVPQNQQVNIAEPKTGNNHQENKMVKQIQKNNLPEIHIEKQLVANNIPPKEIISSTVKNDAIIVSEREKLFNEKETVADNKEYSITTFAYEKPSNPIQTAAYKELDTSPEDANSVAIGTIAINKEKINGLLRKAGSIFGKRTKDEKNADNIKVANLKLNFN